MALCDINIGGCCNFYKRSVYSFYVGVDYAFWGYNDFKLERIVDSMQV